VQAAQATTRIGGLSASDRVRSVVLYGLLVWVVPFVAAMLLYPFRETERPLFEAIMPVVLVGVTVVASARYFATHRGGGPAAGALVGVVWMAISLVLDLLLFVIGPIQMPLLEYVKDIALTYLLIPIITVGLASTRRTG
jgi:hypothetical protein